MPATKRCGGCGDKPISAFNKNSRKPDGLQAICRECQKEHSARHYRKNKAKVLARNRKRKKRLRCELSDYKAAQGCRYCEETDPCCLDLHHTATDKEQAVSAMLTACSWAKVLREVAKCTVVCASCHRKLHAGRAMIAR